MLTRFRSRQGGTSLVEVLVSMVILSVALLSLVVLHGRLHVLQVESYQRSQGLILLNDIASRIALNRNNANLYVTGAPLGAGMVCPVNPVTRQESDFAEWCAVLQGAAETIGASQVGAMVGARACIESIGGGQFLVTVAWQGMAPISAPPASVTCGAGLYDGGAESPCQDDRCRRVMTTIVQVATLI